MDNAVALVQTYLHVNGYFTVAEYPIIGSGRHGDYRTVTELDILAFRFPGATRLVPRLPGRGDDSAEREEPDPVLGTPADQADMLIGEVKDGRRTGIRDFWTLADRGLLPQETTNYVPSVLAASRLLLGTDKTVSEAQEPVRTSGNVVNRRSLGREH